SAYSFSETLFGDSPGDPTKAGLNTGTPGRFASRPCGYGVTAARSTPRGAVSSRQVALATCTAGNGGRATYLPAPASARRSPSSQATFPAESVARGSPVQ